MADKLKKKKNPKPKPKLKPKNNPEQNVCSLEENYAGAGNMGTCTCKAEAGGLLQVRGKPGLHKIRPARPAQQDHVSKQTND